MTNSLKLFFLKPKTVIGFYIFSALFASLRPYFLADIFFDEINNFLIFKTSFAHLIHFQHLYTWYPNEYNDIFLYGPVFSIFISPLTFLPPIIGLIIWSVLNALVVLYAIFSLPNISKNMQVGMAWMCFSSSFTNINNCQYHGITAALIIFSYIFIEKKQDFWAAFCIMLGLMTKIYGVVGLGFFFFSKNKLNLIGSLIFWGIFLFILPMFFSSPSYIINCYREWFETLVMKNGDNIYIENQYQDLGFMGMVRKISGMVHLSNLYYLIPACILMAIAYLKIKLYKDIRYQLLTLASILLFVVLASSSTEASTMLIGFIGATIWYAVSERNVLDKFLIYLALIFTGFGPTELIPEAIRYPYLRGYALMILPLFLIWIKIYYDIFSMKESKEQI